MAIVDLARFKGEGPETNALLHDAECKLERAAELGSHEAPALLNEVQSWRL